MPCATLADMATFTLKLDKGTLRKLTEAADRAGVTPERMAEMMVETWLLADDDRPAPSGVGEPARAWAGAAEVGGGSDQFTTPEDYEGPFVDLDEVEWPEGGDPREDNAANYDLNEVGRPWSEVRPEMEAYLERKLAERK